MNHLFYNKKITGILSILPSTVVKFLDEVEDYPFPPKQSIKLARVMDYNTRRIVVGNESISDYAIYGFNYLLDHNLIKRDDIDAIVVSSSSQDHIMPFTSYLVQGAVGLSKDTLCYDIKQACGGYVVGLMQAFMLIDTFDIKKVLLITGDTLSKKCNKRDRNSRPILGDAVNITIVEKSNVANSISVVWDNYGKDANMIEIKAGGLKFPSNQETCIPEKDEFGNYRSMDDFYMDGEGVFNFVMERAPEVINKSVNLLNLDVKDIDYFMFHQPNKYMVEKLCDEADLPYEKTPSNITGIFGNSSTGTIPLNICYNIADEVLSKDLTLCLSGFGAGLTCNALTAKFKKMDFCKIIEYKH
jgi:3-oxoacyl-[acyl-carrier-protein] synthase-3